MTAAPNIDASIYFIISVPDGKPEEATPLQGFAPSLCENYRLLELVQQFPSNILELTPEYIPHRIARRIGGVTPVHWFGQDPATIRAQFVPEQMAFAVFLLDRRESFSDYEAWAAACLAPVTVVATDGGHIKYSELSWNTLRTRLLSVCEILKEKGNISGAEEARKSISSWAEMPTRVLPYDIQGHGTIVPNVAALRAAGYEIWNVEPFKRSLEEQAYIDQIILTSNTLFDVREACPVSEANRIFPRSIDINFYCPATYDLASSLKLKSDLDRGTRKVIQSTIRLIEKQTGYSHSISNSTQFGDVFGGHPNKIGDQEKFRMNPLMSLRQREVWLGTEAVACLTSSEMGIVVRLPNRMNRTRGIVRQFAQHYRADRPQILKRAELFRGVQRALSDAFPVEFYNLLGRSRDGVRVIADAHVEWLDVKGIPLGLRYNVARIPVTPGNAFISNLASPQPMIIEPDDLLDVLIVSGLREDDIIAEPFNAALAVFGKEWQDRIRITHVRVSTRQQFIDAINAFKGMIMLFDGHGSHDVDRPAVLWLDDVSVDIWKMKGEITRLPPIVILSACDTHAADRNHATVANGFLALGCRSVLGSVFPLHASHAAIFTARLLYRVANYIPVAINMYGRSLTWLEVVSGMLRRQLVTDILRRLESEKLVERNVETHNRIQAIVETRRDDPFSDMRELLIGMGLEPSRLDNEIHNAISNSSTISYLHLGRPETIIINSREGRHMG